MPRRKPTRTQDRRLMTLEQAAVAAGVSVRTLARYRKLGTLDVVKMGRRVLCSIDAIERAVNRKSPPLLGSAVLGEDRDGDPLADWLDLLHQIAAAAPEFENSETLKSYTDELKRRFPTALVRDLTVADLRAVHAANLARASESELVAAIIAAPDTRTVRDALNRLRLRFQW